MQITDMIARTGGLQSMAKELGITEEQAATAANALMPAVLGGFKKQAQTQPGGVEGLGGLLSQLGGGDLLDQVVGQQPTDINRGNAVLGQIFGSKDVSRTVAQNAASKTGLDTGILKKMLPMLAMLAAGYLARQKGAAAAAPSEPSGSGGGLGGILGDLLGGGSRGGGLASMLDMDRDGNPLDDILRAAGKIIR